MKKTGNEEGWEEEGDEEGGAVLVTRRLRRPYGPECLWRDGEHEPEEDPEEWLKSRRCK